METFGSVLNAVWHVVICYLVLQLIINRLEKHWNKRKGKGK